MVFYIICWPGVVQNFLQRLTYTYVTSPYTDTATVTNIYVCRPSDDEITNTDHETNAASHIIIIFLTSYCIIFFREHLSCQDLGFLPVVADVFNAPSCLGGMHSSGAADNIHMFIFGMCIKACLSFVNSASSADLNPACSLPHHP
jgi:hypothetical protein